MFTYNPDERYNTLDDRLYGTSNINTMDADDVVNTVDFRRKILRFDQPNCGKDQVYNAYSIPRYYSSFYPWFRQCFQKKPPRQPCNVDYKRIQVLPPIKAIVTDNKYNFTREYPQYILFFAFLILVYLFTTLAN
jgi:hypothetical protein